VAHEKISLHTDDLAEYATRNGQVSDDISTAANTHLANTSISPTMFGDLGDETGMHNTLSGHMNDMHGHVHTIAGNVRTLGHAVHGAKGDYEYNDELTADWYRRINQR
jgi:hypothetical protein